MSQIKEWDAFTYFFTKSDLRNMVKYEKIKPNAE